jgi:uncharacterized surface anchored protein
MRDGIIAPGRGLPTETQVQTAVLQLAPGHFKLISTTAPDGALIGEVDVLVTSPSGLDIMARALGQFAVNQSKTIVRAAGPLPPVDFGSAGQ